MPISNYPIGGRRPPYKRQIAHKNRKNERIRVPQVRLIASNGHQVGIVSTKEALEMAKKSGLDLVEVSSNARPPVCRILDFGKFMYEESKKGKKNIKSGTAKLKEIKFRINIDRHDYETKLKRAEQFLEKGNQVKLTLMFRGRELQHRDRGLEIIKRATLDLKNMGTADSNPKNVGRSITLTISPLPEQKRKLKFKVNSENNKNHKIN